MGGVVDVSKEWRWGNLLTGLVDTATVRTECLLPFCLRNKPQFFWDQQDAQLKDYLHASSLDQMAYGIVLVKLCKMMLDDISREPLMMWGWDQKEEYRWRAIFCGFCLCLPPWSCLAYERDAWGEWGIIITLSAGKKAKRSPRTWTLTSLEPQFQGQQLCASRLLTV